jgi:hypothetical protein
VAKSKKSPAHSTKRLEAMRPATKTTRPSRGKPTGPKGHLISARYEPRSKIRLTFSDGLSGLWSFGQLELDMTNMKLSTIRVGASGTCIEVTSKWGECVDIDSSSLRAMIDPAFDAKLEAAFLRKRGPIEGLKATAVSLPRK